MFKESSELYSKYPFEYKKIAGTYVTEHMLQNTQTLNDGR